VPCFGGTGCQSAKAAKAELVTQVEMVRPAAQRPALGAASDVAAGSVYPAQVNPADVDPVAEAAEYCRQVEHQARDTNAALPQRLDRDTKATRVAALGCDVVLEYAMLDLSVSDVAVDGVHAMRQEVLQKLCSDRGARGVMEHGGSFTNVYRDEKLALIDQFTITTEDCSERPAAVDVPAHVDL